MLLVILLTFYLPGARFFPVPGIKTAADNVQPETEIGMGGGIFPERTQNHMELNSSDLAPMDVDLELSGIPQPEEFSRPRLLTFNSYTMEKGDIIGNIAAKTGLNEDTLISVNNIKNTRLMQIGQVIRIPNQDGIYYAVKTGDTLENIAEKYKTSVSEINIVNELFSDTLTVNASLFIPGAKMDWVNRQEINGDLFIWPVVSYVTSPYGYRQSPFDGKTRQFHSGLDIGASSGTPIRAAMSGRVLQVGSDGTFGNYVLISHHSGYRTFYAHMSVVRVKAGAYVDTGQRIGDVGATGMVTGPHLHFTVYKNGVTVNPRTLMK